MSPPVAWQSVAEVLSRMQADLDTVWTRERCAEVAGYEVDHFGELFRDVVGESPAAYHRRLRLERAAHELAHEEHLSPREIGQRAGYDSVEGFSRAFRRQFERPPPRFRREETDAEPPVPDPIPAEVLVSDCPPGLSPTPRIEALGPLHGWTVLVRGLTMLPVTAGMLSLVRPAPRVRPFTLGALAQPWGWQRGSTAKEFRCLRLVAADAPTPGPPILAWRQRRTYYAVFDYEGPAAGIEPACFWMAACWVPRSGLRLDYAPLFSLTEGPPSWRGHLRARLHVAVHPLRSP